MIHAKHITRGQPPQRRHGRPSRRQELEALGELAREHLAELSAFVARINEDTADERWSAETGSMFPSHKAWDAYLDSCRKTVRRAR